MKRVHSLIVLALLLAILIPGLFAITPEGTFNLETGFGEESIKSSTTLEKKQVIKIAEYHIKNYLKDDVQTVGKELIPANQFIDLYDIEGNIFAYLVPIKEKGKGLQYNEKQ